MFGVGAGEMVIIFFVLLLAVGPDKMPTLIKSVGKGVREFRKTTRELRNQVGLDDLLGEERSELTRLTKEVTAPLRDVQREVGDLSRAVGTPSIGATPIAGTGAKYMTTKQLEAEQPAISVDVDFALSRPANEAEEPQAATTEEATVS